MVEGAERQKTPNDRAHHPPGGMTLIFSSPWSPSTAGPLWRHGAVHPGAGGAVGDADPHHHRRPALGHRHRPAWIAWCGTMCSSMSGRAVEAAGDVDTAAAGQDRHHHFGNRMATEIIPVPGVTSGMRRKPRCWPRWRTTPPRPLHRRFGARQVRHRGGEHAGGRQLRGVLRRHPHFRRGCGRPPPAQGRCGQRAQVRREIAGRGLAEPVEYNAAVDRIAASGGTPLGLAEGGRLLGVIHSRTW